MDLGTALVVPFLAGVASAASPCLLPLYPGFLAYLSGGTAGGRSMPAWPLGFLVLAGVLTAMLGVGLVLAAVGASSASVVGYLVPVIDALLVVIGLLLLAGRNPFARLPQAPIPVLRHPFAGAYVYGLLLGPVALPCAGPFLVTIFVISVGLADAAPRVLTFLVYGLGFGLPLLALSFLAAARRQALAGQIARHHTAVDRILGTLLVVVGVYDFAINLELTRATFGL
jgi:cytochrome c-type biogenesis protein